MTTLLLILSLFGPIDRERFLNAVAEYETGNNPKAIGKAGEVGAHQMTRAAIKDGRTAIGFFTVTTNRMARLRVPVTPGNVATAWNRGITGASRIKWRATDYSKRVVALYNLSLPAANPKPAPLSPHRPVARAVTLSK